MMESSRPPLLSRLVPCIFVLFFSAACRVIPSKQMNPIELKPELARSLMQKIVSVQPPRNYTNLTSLNRVADILRQQMEEYGYEVKEQEFIAEGLKYKNLRAFYAGGKAVAKSSGAKDHPSALTSASVSAQPRLVIGAHYDVCCEQPGADDNASGLVGVLLLAKLLGENQPELPYAIEFVFYTLEEPPFFGTKLMGSYVHAESLKKENVNVLGMISLEMIGYFTDEDNSQNFPVGIMKLFYPSRGDFIGVVGRFADSKLINHFKANFKREKIRVESLRAPAWVPGVDFSDHRNYWQFGYKAFMITDTSFYRNPNYHTPADTLDTINFSRLVEVVRGTYAAILSLQP